MNQEDAIHIERILLKKDAASYAYIVDKYKNQIFGLSIKILKNQTEAEESAQDTFMKAFNSLSKFKKEAKFSTWLYRIAYNTALTRLNRMKKNVESLNDRHNTIEYDSLNALGELALEDKKKYLKLAIADLPEEDQAIVYLFYHQEKDAKEVGEILNISHNNVRVKLSRLRNKLYIILKKKLKKELNSII